MQYSRSSSGASVDLGFAPTANASAASALPGLESRRERVRVLRARRRVWSRTLTPLASAAERYVGTYITATIGADGRDVAEASGGDVPGHRVLRASSVAATVGLLSGLCVVVAPAERVVGATSSSWQW